MAVVTGFSLNHCRFMMIRRALGRTAPRKTGVDGAILDVRVIRAYGTRERFFCFSSSRYSLQ